MDSKARRLDFMYSSQEEYPFAVLYFTGSKLFNTVMQDSKTINLMAIQTLLTTKILLHTDMKLP